MRLDRGSVIAVKVWLDGKVVDLSLALVKIEHQDEPVLRYVSDDLSIVTSYFYSDEATGAGISNYTLKHPEKVKEVITKDIQEIDAYFKAEEEKRKKLEEERRREAKAKYERIKQSPVTKPSPISGLIFRRSDPELIFGGEYVHYYISIISEETGNELYITDYVTKDGRYLVKKFSRDMHLYWEKKVPSEEPKQILQTLHRKYEKLRKDWD